MDDAGVRSEGREFLARVTLLTDIPLNNQKIDPKIPLSTLTNFNNGQQFNRLTLSNFIARVTKKKKRKIRVSSCRNRNSENYTVTPTTVLWQREMKCKPRISLTLYDPAWDDGFIHCNARKLRTNDRTTRHKKQMQRESCENLIILRRNIHSSDVTLIR